MAVGWYELPRSGQPFYGTIPDGVRVLVKPPAPVAPSGGVDLPPKKASKDTWVTAALNLGLEPGGLTKDEVVALVEEFVEAAEDQGPVGGEVAGVDLSADADEVGTGEDHQEEA